MVEFVASIKNKMLDAVAGRANYVAEPALYLALFNGDPQGAGTEVTTTIRAAGRVAIHSGIFGTAAAAGAISNDALIDFGNAAGGATVTHYAIMDAATLGNVMASDVPTGGTQTVTGGNPVSFAIGALSITLTG